MYRDGEVILEVECGGNKGLLYLSRLCQGSKGPCILFRDTWLTPNEFQYVSGRETAKDWKRSIRHHGKSMKLLLAKGVLSVHPPVCDCSGCRIGSPLVSEATRDAAPLHLSPVLRSYMWVLGVVWLSCRVFLLFIARGFAGFAGFARGFAG